MQVKQRLKISVTVSAITALVILAVLSVALYRVNLAAEESELARDILSSSFERSTFRADYLRTNSERAKVQWFAKHEQIGKLLKTAEERFSGAEENRTTDEMIKDHEFTGRLFSSIVENRDKARSRYSGLSREVEDRLVAQLNMRLYDKVLNARILHEAADRHMLSAVRAAGWSTLFVVSILTIAILINARTMYQTIANRMGRLRDGASMIGEGDLDHRIDITGNDEFTELSAAFNDMTIKLQSSYLELKNEIAERTRAEVALLHRSEKLEIINRELAKSEARYYSLFENMMHGFAYCRMIYSEGDPVDFIYLEVNTAFGKLTGLANVIGRRVSEVIPGIREAHPELFDIYGRVALTGQPEGFEIEFKPLKAWLSISVYSPAREHFVAIFDNIAERKRRGPGSTEYEA